MLAVCKRLYQMSYTLHLIRNDLYSSDDIMSPAVDTKPGYENRTTYGQCFIDSQVTVKRLAKSKFASPFTLEYRHALDSLSGDSQVSHLGHTAGTASDAPHTMVLSQASQCPFQPFPASWSFQEWLEKHAVSKKKKNCIGIHPRYFKYILSLTRRNLKRLSDILTGQCSKKMVAS